MDLYFVPPSCSPTNKYLRFTVGTKPSPSMSCNRVTWVIENTKRKLAMSSCIPFFFQQMVLRISQKKQNPPIYRVHSLTDAL